MENLVDVVLVFIAHVQGTKDRGKGLGVGGIIFYRAKGGGGVLTVFTKWQSKEIPGRRRT